MDWRPREFNTAADHVANSVLNAGADVDTLSGREQCAMQDSVALQVFCDGGYAHGIGAAAFVVTLVVKNDRAPLKANSWDLWASLYAIAKWRSMRKLRRFTLQQPGLQRLQVYSSAVFYSNTNSGALHQKWQLHSAS